MPVIDDTEFGKAAAEIYAAGKERNKGKKLKPATLEQIGEAYRKVIEEQK